MAAQIFGLDIGSSLIKIAEVRGSLENHQLVTAGMAPTLGKGASSDSDADLQAIAGTIRDLADEIKITGSHVVAALPESQIFTRVIDMPVLTENELQSAIKYEAEQYIPIPLSEVKLDYQVLDRPHSQTGDQKMNVLLVAAPNILVKRYLKIIDQAGFKPYALETEITANSRSLININKVALTSLIVDIGASTTKLAIVADRKIAFTRSLAIGGSAFSRAVAQGLGFEIDQAEQYKDTYGLDESQLEGKIAVTIKPIFDVITNEMQRALAFWSGRHPDVVVKSLIATGGSAKMPGLIPYLTSATGLEGQLGNTWETFSFGPNVSPTIRDDSPFYSIAAGLAMKDIVGG